MRSEQQDERTCRAEKKAQKRHAVFLFPKEAEQKRIDDPADESDARDQKDGKRGICQVYAVCVYHIHGHPKADVFLHNAVGHGNDAHTAQPLVLQRLQNGIMRFLRACGSAYVPNGEEHRHGKQNAQDTGNEENETDSGTLQQP